MKRWPILLLVTILLLVSACGSEEKKDNQTSPDNTETSKYTIALVMKTLTNPFFVEMEKGARDAATDYDIDLVVRTAAQETSIEQQIQIIESLIQDDVDAIVIAPGDSEALIPILKKAQDAGIVIVNIDNQLNPELSANVGLVNVPFISVDNQNGAYLSAQFISDQIDSPAEVVILEGIRTAQNAQDRLAGAERAFGENENIQMVDSETANWKIDEAYEVAENLFLEHPDVQAVFASNDMMALGVIQYLKDNNRDDVLVAGYDALDEAKQAIRDGDLIATIDQQAALQGYKGVETAVQLLNNEDVDMLVLVDVIVVTQDNVDE